MPATTLEGNSLGVGIKFRVIAYRQNDGIYQSYQDYAVGETAPSLMPDQITVKKI
ncbi:MAG: hypothetical protein LBE39_11900 [Flavobacteriaceae bacterium]|jgi:hypothetical protein|nr:hypothetical protein [Flavobacteriaceae bacterium]